jgi:hypothetical protein
MKFFALDLHISVIADLKDIFSNLGHSIEDWCLSDHAWVMGRQKSSLPLFNNWQNDLIKKELWNEFFEKYGNVLDKYDGFICCYPPAFSLLYKKFKKPIIIQVPIRYELPFHNCKEDWEFFNNYLRHGVDSGMIFMTANSMYDKKYTEAFLGREVTWIPSLCNYTKIQYGPKTNSGLYYSLTRIHGLENTLEWKKDQLRSGFQWQRLGEYKGIAHFPYNCSTMSMFEQYNAGIPMLFPSMNFLMNLYQNGFAVLNQLTWRGLNGLSPTSLVPYNAPFDPNDFRNIDAVKYWMQYADFYFKEAFQEVLYFDHIEELKTLTKNVGFEQHQKINTHNVCRKNFIYTSWERILKGINLC